MPAQKKPRCRMVTRQGQGPQCSRSAVPGGMGFCRQPVPVKQETDREKWKLRLQGAALVLSATEVLTKIVELAVRHLVELFGPGDSQTAEKNRLVGELDLGPFYPEFPDVYVPGSRVDWETLRELFEDARRAADNPGSADCRDLEQRFSAWFEQLNDYHRGELLKAIAAGAA